MAQSLKAPTEPVQFKQSWSGCCAECCAECYGNTAVIGLSSKDKRDTISADVVSGQASSSQSAIEDSNGNPSVLADLPNSVELQPITPSEAVASEDNGNVVKGPVVHAPSILDKGGQRAASEQSFQGQVNATTGSDSEVELLEVLERVVSSNQVSENMVLLEPPASLDVGSGDTPHGILGLHPMEVEGVIVQAGIKPPEPPDLLGPKAKGTDAKPGPSTGLVNVNALSKSAQKRLRKLAKEQSLSSLSSGGT
ncbi:hypothetical protein RHGRI_004977 [Rhododendron griersonianum]|uniref:Uncharacterized protein n=1 Tax=Rhododendron griersonianum TaxID=479676 RepID=A0AAV6LAK4_9ERIC|nr:hypothetical protein RHGRI_004977 [Rhododendron griersonianum]